ncbi:MAG: NUDIX domain-containing protein [Anaerolineales bacterium]|nr:MAG: NUDIX domain-containing protein [Anaerolineales bacterium]
MTSDSYVKYCPVCGKAVARKFAHGRERPVCESCGHVHFEEPKVAAGVLVFKDEQVLLVRRSMQPNRGKWSLPAGFVDADEDPAVAAAREVLEETGLVVGIDKLLDVIYGKEHPNGASIVILYTGRIKAGRLRAADDVDAAEFFDLGHLPPLAFAATQKALESIQKIVDVASSGVEE